MPDIVNLNARGVAVTLIFDVTQAPMGMTDQLLAAQVQNGVAVSAGLCAMLKHVSTSAVRPLTDLLPSTH